MDKDPYNRGYEKTVKGTIAVLEQVAEKGTSHIAFQDGAKMPEYLSLPPRLRELASALRAADSLGNIGEVKTKWTEAIRALYFNSKHIMVLAEHHNDPSILDAGYPMKQKPVSKGKVSLLDLEPELTAKYMYADNIIVSGGFIIAIKRASNHAIVELQITETPNDEGSWRRLGEGTYDASRVKFRGYQEMTKIYIRGRYHHKGATGRWSQPVSIIIH